jgi:hypothetical protein
VTIVLVDVAEELQYVVPSFLLPALGSNTTTVATLPFWGYVVEAETVEPDQYAVLVAVELYGANTIYSPLDEPEAVIIVLVDVVEDVQ